MGEILFDSWDGMDRKGRGDQIANNGQTKPLLPVDKNVGNVRGVQ